MNTNSKLRACLTIILTFVMGWMYADSITLPGFKTKDDIADKVISDLTSFAQTTGDFTLEAKAKAGVAITLKFGNISYTPSADGIVRFVQQAGKVYVLKTMSTHLRSHLIIYIVSRKPTSSATVVLKPLANNSHQDAGRLPIGKHGMAELLHGVAT